MTHCLDPDPDQNRHSVSLDLGPNCKQRLSADDKTSLEKKERKSKPHQSVSGTIAFYLPSEVSGGKYLHSN